MSMKKDQKNANATTPVTNPISKEKGKVKKENLDKANLAKTAAKVTEARESKYNYPADITTPEQKKTFRRNARAQRDRFKAEIAKLMASTEKKDKATLKAIQEEERTWTAATYSSKES